MTKNTMLLLLAAGAAYYLYSKKGPSAFMTCVYPDGTQFQIPQGNSCPYDNRHGGQSQVMCYFAPVPAGGTPC